MLNNQYLKPMKKMIFLQTLLIAALVSWSFACNNPGQEVQKAYEMRMKGDVDGAKALLDNILAEDSTNAMAHYEMARLKHYMLLGGGGTNLEGLNYSIAKAVAYDPGNPIYQYYNAIVSFLNAYIVMESGQGPLKELIGGACAQFEKVLTLKPDYYEAMLYLVEIYGLLPPDMGGDSVKAAFFRDKLTAADHYYGAKAVAILLPEDTDMVKYWEDLLASDPADPDLLKEAGLAYLYKEDPVNAELYFEKSVKSDPSRNTFYLDLARYHVMMVMQNQDKAAAELPLAKTMIEKYLQATPAPSIPMKAYATGLLAQIEMFLGNQAEGEKLMQEANTLDKYFSKAFGLPMQVLFDPPDKISHHFLSFFRPF
jgi:tetratricopeptide (TPR) repeat protein